MRKLFGLFSHSFSCGVVEKAFYKFKETFSWLLGFSEEKCFLILVGHGAKNFQPSGKNSFGSIDQAALYLSKGTFWKEKIFLKKKFFKPLPHTEPKIFGLLSSYDRRVVVTAFYQSIECFSWLLSFFEKKLFFNLCRTLSEKIPAFSKE